jgi:hypothetical protein
MHLGDQGRQTLLHVILAAFEYIDFPLIARAILAALCVKSRPNVL